MKAIDYIKKGWTQGATARDCYGNFVSSTNKAAVCFCATGAIIKVYKDAPDIEIAMNKLRLVIGSKATSIINWNDFPLRTLDEVITAFEKAGI